VSEQIAIIMSPAPLTRKSPFHTGRRQNGVALVITLALLSVLVLILVTFVSISQFDSAATASYSKSMSADQLARSSLNLVVGQLQMEMGKDALPDTGGGLYPNSPVYTNVVSANILPQGVGTNTDIPSLVKISTNAPFFTAGAAATSQLEASTVSSTTPSQNGRSVSQARWQQSYFGTFSSANEAPYWVMMTRSGATNAAGLGFGASGNTLNNAAPANANYAIGRFAYAVYNEGGLLDVTAAGTSSTLGLTASQQDLLKGRLAGADLTQLSGLTPNTLTQWRNPAGGSGASASVYTNALIGYASTNAAGSVYPGDTTFVSRQDLINAALLGGPGPGLTTNALTNLTTFTRESNRPSWAPGTNAPSSAYQYAATASAVTTAPFSASNPNPNPLIPLVRVANSLNSYQYYGDDGTLDPNPDPIVAGDPVVRRRFSLARLAWLGPSGPANGGTKEAIQACFGLMYLPSLDSANLPGATVWRYVGPTGSNEQSSIETLSQVAAENPPREPNFFELLQAGILSGSLATDGGSSTAGATYNDTAQRFTAFQILRIGANIICQYNTDSYPRLIEYTGGDGDPWVAAGIQNLPYLNVFKDVSGASLEDSPSTQKLHYAEVYYTFGLWNPHQQNPGVTYNRPPIRICVETGPSASSPGVGCSSGWASSAYSSSASLVSGEGGYEFKIPVNSASAQLSSSAGQGINGFLNPGLLTSADVTSSSPAFPTSEGGAISTTGGSTTGGWITMAATDANGASHNFFTYRLPDLQVDLSMSATTTPPAPAANSTPARVLATFEGLQIVLEYQDTNGNWVPYDYWVGINDPLTWQTGFYFDFGALINPGSGSPPYVLPDPSGTFLNGNTPVILTCDPRTFRFNPWAFTRDGAQSQNKLAPIDSLWSDASGNGAQAANLLAGYGGAQENPVFSGAIACMQRSPSLLFPNWYFPAALCRNNTANNITTPASSYVDPDGVQRIGDSGLYTGFTQAGSATGNPYLDPSLTPNSLRGQRMADRPIILNRPFTHVGELGYAFRDDPWRSLDFFSVYNGTSTSADSGLLDLFSVNEEPPVLAGRVDLNTQNPLVLQSVLSQTLADVENSVMTHGDNLGSAAVQQLASQLVKFTAANPLVNKDQLVTRFGPTLTSAAFDSTDAQNVKATRESFIRTLADVGQTRTWNLMIDLVAQTGRYAPTATSTDQFVVEGEHRYWLHVAIDRFTGKVIDQRLEPVAE
jgi:hypothetical protein